MSGETKKTRSNSDETQIRKLLVDLTDHVLAMKEQQAKETKMLIARFEDIDTELGKLRQGSASAKRKLDAVAMLAADALSKVNDLHQKQIGTADKIGKRIYDLETQRSARGNGPTRRPPR